LSWLRLGGLLGLGPGAALGRLLLGLLLVRRGLGLAAASAADHGQLGPDLHGVVGLDLDRLEDPCHRGRDLGVDLVGGHLEQRLVRFDLVTLLLEPAGDGPLGDRLAQLGHGHGGRLAVPGGTGLGSLGRLLLGLVLGLLGLGLAAAVGRGGRLPLLLGAGLLAALVRLGGLLGLLLTAAGLLLLLVGLGLLALVPTLVAAGLAVLLDDGQLGPDLDRLVGLDLDGLQDPGHRGGDLGVDLVGGHLEQGLVGLDPVALLLDPPGDRALGDRLTELRHLDWCRH
jgi:hypothetical protein